MARSFFAPRIAAALAGAALCLAMSACTSQTKLRDADLEQLASWFPGVYDNRDQAAAEHAAGQTLHEAVTLTIIPVYAPMFGDAVFYLHETASDDLRRVMSQRIASFAVAKDRIVETIWTFVDPIRWREGLRDPDLFKSMVAQDLKEASGCAMLWHKAGDRFNGNTDSQTCRVASRSTGALVAVDAAMDLGERDLVVAPDNFRFAKRSEQP